ncbi:MAG: hypothetical protein KC621_34595, partial [Myxococcales bacterium]|nr:hypothetical protein [Myxococcales bacterium]
MREQTFLQLAPEFGGTKFGPFDHVEVRLGSDPSNSDITLPPTLGVADQHVKLIKQQDGSFIVAPVDRTAAVFHFRAGSGRPKQVLAPTAVSNGDSFALVTPEGPRFFILLEKDPRAAARSAEEAEGPGWKPKMPGNMGNNRFARGIWREIKRRGFAAVFTTRLGNMAMRLNMMVRSGAIFSPIYMVGGILMISGWLFAGGTSCSAFRMSRARSQATTSLTNCRDQLGVAQGADGQDTDPTVPELTRVVLEDPEWKNTVLNDKDLYTAYAAALRTVFSDATRYRWVYTKQNSQYDRFRQMLEGTGMPPALVRSLAFATATPTHERDWVRVTDSEGSEVCGRGPLGLTYRQAVQLGLETVQPDALVERAVAESNDIRKQREELDKTTGLTSDIEVTYRDDMVQVAGVEQQGGLYCLYVDGIDDRKDLRKIALAMQKNLGASKTKKLPA